VAGALRGSDGGASGRGPTGRPGRKGQTQMREDLLHHGRILDRGDQTQPAAAARTGQHVQPEGALHEHGPRLIARPAYCGRMSWGNLRQGTSKAHHALTPGRVRGQHAVVENQMRLGPRCERRQPLKQFKRLKQQMRRAVAPGLPQLDQGAAVAEAPEPLGPSIIWPRPKLPQICRVPGL